MRQTTIVLLFSAGLLLHSCSDEDRVIHHPSVEPTAIPLSWSVMPLEDMKVHTRALLDNSDMLEDACRPGTGEGIGIWGDYELNTYEGTQIFEGFLNNVKLICTGTDSDEDYPQDPIRTNWDYSDDTEDQYWVLGGKYKFRAYFPVEGVDIVSSSNATTFAFEWNSIQMQTDLLVAYKEIDTKTWDLRHAVPLEMKHALSALQFNFRFVDGYYTEDKLTGCWLENSKEDDFSCVGIFVYGGSSDAENMTWAGAYAYEPGVDMYKWTYDTGIPIESTESGTVTMATAYTGGATSGGQYITNDGWLLVIPQQLSGEVYLCFTTEKGGSNIYRAKIPANTGTDGSYKPGYKYKYTVNISKTNLELDLSIAKWNKLDSSHDIKF